MEMFALLFTLFLPSGYKMATFLFFLYKNASLPGHQSLFDRLLMLLYTLLASVHTGNLA